MFFTLSFQVLPVKEIGKLLAYGAFSEEIQCSNMVDITELKIKTGLPLWQLNSENHDGLILRQKAKNFIPHKDQIPNFFIGDIFSPPPNA